ncbi:MAG: hypothetical protein ABIH11_08150 [Candidatus Altiarchaeota archaeon]
MSGVVCEVREEVTRHYAGIFEEMGLSSTMIDIYMSLFFSKEPMGLQEIAGDTGYSVSTVCNTIDLLVKYTDVRKFKKPGSKKIYYECTHDIKKAMRNKISGHQDMIRGLINVLKESEEKLVGDDDPDAERIRGDIGKLRKDYEKIDKIISLLITMKLIDKSMEDDG